MQWERKFFGELFEYLIAQLILPFENLIKYIKLLKKLLLILEKITELYQLLA